MAQIDSLGGGSAGCDERVTRFGAPGRARPEPVHGRSNVEPLQQRRRSVLAGGVIPAQDYDYLYQNGASAIFGPGTVIPDSARKILTLLLEQVEE